MTPLSIVAFLKELLALWNSYFSAEARLRRKMVKEAERQGQEAVLEERLKAQYRAIEKEGDDDAEIVAKRLSTRRTPRKPPTVQ